jgi:hypothetical protein
MGDLVETWGWLAQGWLFNEHNRPSFPCKVILEVF